MKKATEKTLNGLIAILFLDILGSVASNRLGFNYSLLSPISFSVYTAVGFFVAKQSNKKTAVVSTAILGLFDATAGWWVSIFLQANTGAPNEETTIDNIIGTVILMSFTASSFGLLGSWIGSDNSKKNKKYRPLNNTLVAFSSVLAMRLLVGFILGMGLILTVSSFLADKEILPAIFIASAFVIFTYLATRLSSIIYDQEEIVIQNVRDKYVYNKDELLEIRPWKSFLNIYFIEFNDGSSFLFFGYRLTLDMDANKDALEFKRKLIEKPLERP